MLDNSKPFIQKIQGEAKLVTARQSRQCEIEMFGRQVGKVMRERGLSIEQLASMAGILQNYLSQLVEGQATYLRPQWNRQLARVLIENRGQFYDVPDEDVISLFVPDISERIDRDFRSGT